MFDAFLVRALRIVPIASSRIVPRASSRAAAAVTVGAAANATDNAAAAAAAAVGSAAAAASLLRLPRQDSIRGYLAHAMLLRGQNVGCESGSGWGRAGGGWRTASAPLPGSEPESHTRLKPSASGRDDVKK